MSKSDGSSNSDDNDERPVHRPFGAGLKRKFIEFVPPEAPSQHATPKVAPNRSLGEKYLSITLKDRPSSVNLVQEDGFSVDVPESTVQTGDDFADGDVCEFCKLPLLQDGVKSLQSHEVSMAHQICVEHSHPPSHLDRDRPGLKYLSSYGWDPDARVGLGAAGNGIRVPIKATVKHDTVGLGVNLPEVKQKIEKVVEKLDAKGIRRSEAEKKRERDKLQQMFYGNSDVEKYLGSS